MKKKDKKEIGIRVAIMAAAVILFAIAMWKGQTTEFGDVIIAIILVYNMVNIGKLY